MSGSSCATGQDAGVNIYSKFLYLETTQLLNFFIQTQCPFLEPLFCLKFCQNYEACRKFSPNLPPNLPQIFIWPQSASKALFSLTNSLFRHNEYRRKTINIFPWPVSNIVQLFNQQNPKKIWSQKIKKTTPSYVLRVCVWGAGGGSSI